MLPCCRVYMPTSKGAVGILKLQLFVIALTCAQDETMDTAVDMDDELDDAEEGRRKNMQRRR